MFPVVNTQNTAAVEAETLSIYLAMFPEADHAFVPQVFQWMVDCFQGRYQDYQPIDARYHDLEHTMQGTLCLMRLLHGRHRAKAAPPLTRRMFELGLLAILLHDTGYLKRRADTEGTGAKYTLIHVNRSVEFARELLAEKGYPAEDITAVQHMIRCTGVNVDLTTIPFQSELVRLTGFALGSADLLGQMAAADYVDKLPVLYSEFEESARFNAGKTTAAGAFASAEDLIRKTPLFWEKYVVPKIEKDFLGQYHFLSEPFPDGPNEYLNRVLANIERVKQVAAKMAG
ncbi:MAG: hypothetical protein HZA89_01030 [Verrucomicrobia bacterium]|nr:hypothetical protein [Verrucomicrobiota bacterium]